MCTHEESLHGRCVACGMTWEEQSRFPVGVVVATTVCRIGGGSETVTGTVAGHKRGGLVVTTESHGTLWVARAKAEPVS